MENVFLIYRIKIYFINFSNLINIEKQMLKIIFVYFLHHLTHVYLIFFKAHITNHKIY
jgi:hypothetical protein